MKFPYGVMTWPVVYRLWEAPFIEKKFAPVAAHNDLKSAGRVLDLGCGPGINTHHFTSADYLGVDINAKYIASAERRHSARFIAADGAEFVQNTRTPFDFVLVNSFLHHIDLVRTRQILSGVSRLVTAGGHVHILELVLPEKASLSRFLARADRGKFPRPLAEWESLFKENFDPVVFEPYDLGLGHTALWEMVYFKGRPKR